MYTLYRKFVYEYLTLINFDCFAATRMMTFKGVKSCLMKSINLTFIF